MKLHDIREMIKLVNQSSIEELEWEQDGKSIVIKKAAPAAIVVTPELPVPEIHEISKDEGYQQAAATAEEAQAVVESEAAADQIAYISSASVGLFYAVVTPGQTIKTGDLVGRLTVESLQLTEEVRAAADGEITEILVEDGQLVDYGRKLLAVKIK